MKWNTMTKMAFNAVKETGLRLGLIGLLSLPLINCNGIEKAIQNAIENSGSASSGTESASSENSDGVTSGKIKAADGSSIAGASVALVQSTSNNNAALKTSFLTNENGQFFPSFAMTDDDGQTCDDITDGLSGTVLATDCTDSDGSYTLAMTNIPCGTPLTFVAKKGSFSLSVDVTLSCDVASQNTSDNGESVAEIGDIVFDDDCGTDDSEASQFLVAPSAAFTVDQSSCQFDAARMAVVTGNYDEIENVLAKLGFGSVDENGILDKSQPFDFTLIDGNDTLNDADYMNFDEFVSDINNLNQYDIIFINCGNSYELLASDPDTIAILQEYVENGGKLYVTDWSYGFIEQPFPSFMNFFDGGDDPQVGETHGHAKVGMGGITVDATVNDNVLSAWLDGVRVNDGTIEQNCYNLADEDVNAIQGARNEDGSVTVADFLGSWAVMLGEHDGFAGASDIWMQGDVTHYNGDVQDAPLTVTRDEGLGRILYSSYHTAHSCPTPGFWAQERVLQFLVFEL